MEASLHPRNLCKIWCCCWAIVCICFGTDVQVCLNGIFVELLGRSKMCTLYFILFSFFLSHNFFLFLFLAVRKRIRRIILTEYNTIIVFYLSLFFLLHICINNMENYHENENSCWCGSFVFIETWFVFL